MLLYKMAGIVTILLRKGHHMQRDPREQPPTPSTEDKVRRIIEAGERARSDTERQADERTTNAGNRLEESANRFDTRADESAERVKVTAQRFDEKAAETGDRVEDAGHKVSSRTEQAAERGKDFAHKASDKARELAHDLRSMNTETAKEKAGEARVQATEKTDEAMTATGQRIEHLAQTVRERAPEGKAGEVALQTATALERSGRYLQQAHPQDVRNDLETLIRQHPIESLLVGAGFGFLLARTMRRR